MPRFKQTSPGDGIYDPRKPWRDLIIEICVLSAAILTALVAGYRIQWIEDDADLPWLAVTAVSLYEIVWRNILLITFALFAAEAAITAYRLKSMASVATIPKVIEKDHTMIWSIAIAILAGLMIGWMTVGYFLSLPIGTTEL